MKELIIYMNGQTELNEYSQVFGESK